MISLRSFPSKFAVLQRPSHFTLARLCQIPRREIHASTSKKYPKGIPLYTGPKLEAAKELLRAKKAAASGKETKEVQRRSRKKSPKPPTTTSPKTPTAESVLETSDVAFGQPNDIETGTRDGPTTRRVGRPSKVSNDGDVEPKPGSADGGEKIRHTRKYTKTKGESKSTRKQLLGPSDVQESTGTNSVGEEDERASAPTSESTTEGDGWTKKIGLLLNPVETGSPNADMISKHILKKYTQSRRDGEKIDQRRLHVVSKELCDDVLERLKPSLEKHIGCDIIDLNPGVGVWSSTIHDFLKPRTHILLEPEESAYKPLLQPLLDAKDSTYKLVPKSGIIWGHLEEVLTPKFLPHQVELSKTDPLIQQRNDTLLLVANLGYYPKRLYRAFPSITSLVIHQLLSASRAHSLCHKYGLVRMLVWVPEDEKATMFPRNIAGRRKAAIQTELSCEMYEIASSTYVANFGHREQKIELESSQATIGKMEEAGIKTPKSRLKPLQMEGAKYDGSPLDMAIKWSYLPELEDLEKRYAAGEFEAYRDDPEVTAVLNRRHMYSKDLLTPEWIRYCNLTRREKSNKKLGRAWGIGSQIELEELQQRLAAGEFTKYSIPEAEVPNLRRRGGPWAHTPEFRRLTTLRNRKLAHTAKNNMFQPILEEYDAIIEKQKVALSATDSESVILWDEIKTRNEALKEIVADMHEEDFKGFLAQLDNRRAFYQDPPILLWDRRNFEPLKVTANDFYPRHEMALIDIHPKALWPILQGTSPENYEVLEYIISYLLMVPKQSVREGLLGLWPGAYDLFLSQCPSLTDPNKGGNADLGLLSVRCVTQEMFKEMTEAWIAWPFRPKRTELIRRMGTGVHDPGDDPLDNVTMVGPADVDDDDDEDE